MPHIQNATTGWQHLLRTTACAIGGVRDLYKLGVMYTHSLSPRGLSEAVGVRPAVMPSKPRQVGEYEYIVDATTETRMAGNGLKQGMLWVERGLRGWIKYRSLFWIPVRFR